MEKKCSMCGKIKNVSEFHKNNKTKDGFSYHCKECRKKYKSKVRKSFINVVEKTCYLCGETKPIAEFYNDKRRKDGHRNMCKECEKKKLREYLTKNRRVLTEKVCLSCGKLKPISMFHRSSATYDGHKEYCKDCRCKYPAGYAEKLRMEIIKSGKKKCTKCKQIKPLSEFYKRKKGKIGYTSICKSCWSKKYADYYEKNYEHIIEITQKRHALEKSLEINFTKDDWLYCLAYFNYSCAYCGKHSNKLQQDHFVPVIKLGGYTRDNILPACPKCNRSKGSKDFKEWFRSQEFYSLKREIFIMKYLNQFKEGVANGYTGQNL